MNQRIRELWQAALTSGDYEQGDQSLRIGDAFQGDYTYCCLGVLCDLYRQEHDDEATAFEGGLYPGPRVLRWADLGYPQSHEYADMNDSQGLSFDEIADFVAMDETHWIEGEKL